MFNAIKYTEELEKAGFTGEQAKVSLKVLIEVMNENFATKSDIHTLSMEIGRVDTKIDKVGAELINKIDRVDSKVDQAEAKLTHKIEQTKSDLIIRLGSMMALAIGLVATLVKLL